MRILSWNINSVRIRTDSFILIKNIIDPDVICLQETKVIDELFPYDFFLSLGYDHIKFCGEKSYNGVAIISKLPIFDVNYHKLVSNTDCRHISAIINNIEIHNFYIPAGGDIADIDLNPKFAFKLSFLDEIYNWFKDNRTIEHKMILLGDLNVAPYDNDVWSHKQLSNIVSHTFIEIEKLNKIKSGLDWCDTHREFTDISKKLYSWWSYRNKDWMKSDRGRRLDHIWISQNLRKYLSNAVIFKDARSWNKPSDHVPIYVDLNI